MSSGPLDLEIPVQGGGREPRSSLAVRARFVKAPDYRHAGLNSAYRRGVAAFAAGLALASNPYPDLRTAAGKVTFSRAYRNAWQGGWVAASAVLLRGARFKSPCP